MLGFIINICKPTCSHGGGPSCSSSKVIGSLFLAGRESQSQPQYESHLVFSLTSTSASKREGAGSSEVVWFLSARTKSPGLHFKVVHIIRKSENPSWKGRVVFHPKIGQSCWRQGKKKVALEEEVWKQLITKVQNKNKELRLHKGSRQLYAFYMYCTYIAAIAATHCCSESPWSLQGKNPLWWIPPRLSSLSLDVVAWRRLSLVGKI